MDIARKSTVVDQRVDCEVPAERFRVSAGGAKDSTPSGQSVLNPLIALMSGDGATLTGNVILAGSRRAGNDRVLMGYKITVNMVGSDGTLVPLCPFFGRGGKALVVFLVPERSSYEARVDNPDSVVNILVEVALNIVGKVAVAPGVAV